MKGYRLTVLMYQDHTLGYGKRNSRSSMFRIVPKFKKEKSAKKTSPQSGRAVRTSPSVVNTMDGGLLWGFNECQRSHCVTGLCQCLTHTHTTQTNSTVMSLSMQTKEWVCLR